ncbi:MAG: FHA domain protein [Firmicutes bacterium ADurb.Bin080]|nr:MAG: FHA domain protein [Firmicutes bacterium ADurb.Bin080]
MKFGKDKVKDPKVKCPNCNANVSEVPKDDRFFCPFCGESLKRKSVILSANGNRVRIPINSISPSGREDFKNFFPPSVLSYISRRHFKFTEVENEVCIEDVGSANGTLVNGAEIQGKGIFVIKSGDTIDLGGRLRVTVEGIEFEEI